MGKTTRGVRRAAAVVPDARCSPSRINAQCFPNLQAATAAAITANQPLWLPAGTYRLTRELVIDYASLAHSGLQVISDVPSSMRRRPASLR